MFPLILKKYVQKNEIADFQHIQHRFDVACKYGVIVFPSWIAGKCFQTEQATNDQKPYQTKPIYA